MMIKDLSSDKLSEYDKLLNFVRKGVEQSKQVYVSDVESDEKFLKELEKVNQDAMIEALSEQRINFSDLGD